MRDRELVEDAGGWGLSVTRIQEMPTPEPRHVEETTAAITGRNAGGAGHVRPGGRMTTNPRPVARIIPAPVPIPEPEPQTRPNLFIELENVTVSYGKGSSATKALEDISLQIGQGDFVALVGPSGCGKSTILKLVDRSSQGDQRLCLRRRPRGRRAEPMRVGMAFQNPTLLPWLSIRDNVMLPLKIVPPFRHDWGSKRKTEFRDRVDTLLAQVGLRASGANIPGSCPAA